MVINAQQLSELTGLKRPGDIARWCEKNGIKYFHSRAGIWTTLDALNAALGVVRDTLGSPAGSMEF